MAKEGGRDRRPASSEPPWRRGGRQVVGCVGERELEPTDGP
jgi:hypothetical protein